MILMDHILILKKLIFKKEKVNKKQSKILNIF